MVANDNYYLVHLIDRSKIPFYFWRHALRCGLCGRALAMEDARETWVNGTVPEYILTCYPDCENPEINYERRRTQNTEV